MGYTNKSSDPSEDDYKAQDDARVLKNHAEITSDPDRHAKALAHMQNEQVTNQKALDSGHKQLKGKVKKGLAKAFPKEGGTSGKTPFEKAATGE